jgi:hypothetical protein
MMKNFSMTQGGNLGQLVSVVLLFIGFATDSADAEAKANAVIIIVLSLVVYVVSFGASWIGRWRAGDLKWFGARK